MPIGLRAVVTGAMMPVVALALWATGGATSFLQPILFFTVLFAWPVAQIVATGLVTDARIAVVAGDSEQYAGLVTDLRRTAEDLQHLESTLEHPSS